MDSPDIQKMHCDRRERMRIKFVAMTLAAAMVLSGCSLFDGYYVSVTPHQEQSGKTQMEVISANNYYQLCVALQDMVASGTESNVIHIADYDSQVIEENLQDAIAYIKNLYPIGAYAVEDITYEVGFGSGKPAIALSIVYNRTRGEIRSIRNVKDIEKAEEAIGDALKNFDTVLALQIDNYRASDFVQMVEDYAENHPEYVVETPTVAVEIFGTSTARVVELSFSYQTSRESLKQMKLQVQPIFDAASLYVSGAPREKQKFSQLYGFLMERFEYTLETSITPAYSLLLHGVGDSRAFALTYASMCRRAGLDCRIVTGTRNGEPWTWNIVLDNGYYYHVDLLRSSALGGFEELVDTDMIGYVWDYSAYPECVSPYVLPSDQQSMAGEPFVPEDIEAAAEKTE